MPAALRKLLDRWRAQRALLRARRRLAREPIGELTAKRSGVTVTASGDAQRAREVADAVRWAAAHGVFRPFCLVQALALHELLEAAAVHGSEIRVGVRNREGRFAAHAWVRWGQEVLGDDPDYVTTFTEVDDIGVLAQQ